MNKKLSFLMAAHNEEKIISKSLNELSKLPYKNYEVLIGLDGCNDRTEEIVKSYSNKFKNFRYWTMNIRNGKPAVINELIKSAQGDIIIIQDADWIFRVESKELLEEFLSVFNDIKVGGIAESFPVEWNINKIKNGNLTYKMVAYSAFFWMLFQKEKLSKKIGDKLYVVHPRMFLTNIFRKELYKENMSLGDDFERTQDIFNEGYKIVVFPKESYPRMIAVYDKIKFGDFFRQKIRTAMARKQLNKTKKMPVNLSNYYLSSVWFIFVNSWKKSFYVGSINTFWILIVVFSEFIAKFKETDTKKGWTLRARR